jgi:tyrosyl-tRNA synthetase
MGKTVSGAVWLDPNKTSPYDFYQYWRNVDDADVIKCLKMLTDLSLEEIAEMETWTDSRINKAKEILAFELTKLVHGEEEATKAQQTAQSLFSTGGDLSNMPTTTVSADELPIDAISLLVKTGLAPSKSEARRMIQQNGVSVNGEKLTAIDATYSADDLAGDGLMIKKGKKVFHRVVLG